MIDRFRVTTAVVRMQPRRNARVGGGWSGGGASWLGTSWGGGLAGRGAAWGGIGRPSVIRVGHAYQALVPLWTGPVALDSSPWASFPAGPAQKRVPTGASGAGGGARYGARNADPSSAAVATGPSPPKRNLELESESDRARRLAGIKVWPPEGSSGRHTQAHSSGGGGVGSQRLSVAGLKADLFRSVVGLSPIPQAENKSADSPSNKRLSHYGPDSAQKRARMVAEKEENETAGPKSALALIPINPSVKAAAAARAAAAMARVIAASRLPSNGHKSKDSIIAMSTTQRLTSTGVASTGPKVMQGPPCNVEDNEDVIVVSDDPLLMLAARRPDIEDVMTARCALDANLRANRSSPAIMGLERMGVSAAKNGGWSSVQCAAFEEHLQAQKFNLFAVSRLGQRKPTKSSTNQAGAMEKKPSGSSSDPEASSSGEDEEHEADVRLAGISLHAMVDYYYNVWLTRPGAEDDDDDRSECGEGEANSREGHKRGPDRPLDGETLAGGAGAGEAYRLHEKVNREIECEPQWAAREANREGERMEKQAVREHEQMEHEAARERKRAGKGMAKEREKEERAQLTTAQREKIMHELEKAGLGARPKKPAKPNSKGDAGTGAKVGAGAKVRGGGGVGVGGGGGRMESSASGRELAQMDDVAPAAKPKKATKPDTAPAAKTMKPNKPNPKRKCEHLSKAGIRDGVGAKAGAGAGGGAGGEDEGEVGWIARSASGGELAQLDDSAPAAKAAKAAKPPKQSLKEKRAAARASKEVAGLLQWMQSAASNVYRAGVIAARAKDLHERRSAMMERWRMSRNDVIDGPGAEAWADDVVGIGKQTDYFAGEATDKAQVEARNAWQRKQDAVNAICQRPLKHPQWPNAEVAFSSDDES